MDHLTNIGWPHSVSRRPRRLVTWVTRPRRKRWTY